jgi:transposase-like protein
MRRKKSNFSAAFKAKIGCIALKENQTTNEISSEHGIHGTQINQWKKVILEQSEKLFERKKDKKSDESIDIKELQRIIGQQAIQLEWYKKKLGIAYEN